MRIAGLVGAAALAANLHAGNRAPIHNRPCGAPDVTVYVASAGVLDLQTKDLAGRMLAAVGVQVVWRVGEPKPDAAGGLVVSLRTGEAPPEDERRGALARAYPFGGGVHSITVFQDQVQATAAASGVEVFKVTAHVLVHEIAHVLERIDRHSDTGVMKAHWTRAEYRAMAWKPLPFAEEDVEWIHRTLEDLREQCRIAVKKSSEPND
jgi:hypothetical protein